MTLPVDAYIAAIAGCVLPDVVFDVDHIYVQPIVTRRRFWLLYRILTPHLQTLHPYVTRFPTTTHPFPFVCYITAAPPYALTHLVPR